ncbi:hypothetical protein IFM89_006038 [Coptis chinensis]|uniref:FAS1 domain-containing protein n=1 Tax=Coptis chinensis TaxID=261450 RepID=A0A835M2A9_9MAGN|nr:hypothetical protein IFM89_006038 [Coptis chinensis]
MAIYLTVLILVMAFAATANTSNKTSRNENLAVAIHEMQTATYFSFVMLIKMYKAGKMQGNITFLMPSDRTLSEITLPKEAINDFMLRHTIPSTLLFDHLQGFPTGSMIPTSQSDYMLRISNNGRKNFYLNNVQIIKPNICTAGSSIRCHGIKGVLMPMEPASNATLPSPTCSPHNPKAPTAPPISPKHPAAPATPTHRPSPFPPMPSQGPIKQISTAAPPPTGSKKSSSDKIVRGILHSVAPCMILAFVTFKI